MAIQLSAAWKYALVPTVIVLFLAIYPQINIWSVQGRDWHGAYVVSNYDEVAYSAYVNSLIQGRARRSDPFIGKDDASTESLYSIQMVPAYAIALPARFFGFSASTAFILLNFLIPIFASLAIFVFIRAVTDDVLLSAVGVGAVLCLGALIAFQGELQHMISGSSLCEFFPFLRRYQPGFAFPIFFLFCLFTWRSFTAQTNGRGIIYAGLSGVTLGVLVFSYFFLWTAAAGWFGLLTVLWLFARKEDRAKTLLRVVIVGAFGVSAVVPYFILLSDRSPNTDGIQLLFYTRMPDLFELPEIIGFLIAVIILVLARKKRVQIDSPPVLLTLSLALTPFVLFNQQIITGRSLQPVHYEIFIVNYLLLVAIVFLIFLVRQSVSGESFEVKYRRALIYAGVAIVVWGFVESSAAARRNAGYEKMRDDAMPALTYIRDTPSPQTNTAEAPTVLSTELAVAEYIPTVTTDRPLWNPHTNSAGGVDQAQNLDLFYKYLYYSGFDENDLARAIDGNLFEVKAALFGGGRALPTLTSDSKPVTKSEVQGELKKYRDFQTRFDQTQASNPVLSFIVVPARAEPNYSNLDRWYQRDAGRDEGAFKVYTLTPKFTPGVPTQ